RTGPGADRTRADHPLRGRAGHGHAGDRFPRLHPARHLIGAFGGLRRGPGPNLVGELWIKGPNIVRGYWNKPEATAASFTRGWLHSGDIARVDEEGFGHI